MYTMMKFLESEQLVLYMAELGLNTGYVKIPIDWKEQNFKLHLKKHAYRASSIQPDRIRFAVANEEILHG